MRLRRETSDQVVSFHTPFDKQRTTHPVHCEEITMFESRPWQRCPEATLHTRQALPAGSSHETRAQVWGCRTCKRARTSACWLAGVGGEKQCSSWPRSASLSGRPRERRISSLSSPFSSWAKRALPSGFRSDCHRQGRGTRRRQGRLPHCPALTALTQLSRQAQRLRHDVRRITKKKGVISPRGTSFLPQRKKVIRGG